MALGAPIPSKCAFFPPSLPWKLDQTLSSSDFQGQLALYVITHFSNWWDALCGFSQSQYFLYAYFFLSSANILGTWEKKFLDLKVNMGSKSFSCYRISGGVCCLLGGGTGHSGRHQVSGNQKWGGSGGFYGVMFLHGCCSWCCRPLGKSHEIACVQ